MKLDIKISFNENGQIAGFYFVPHKEINNDKALGTDLNINSNSVALKATVTTISNLFIAVNFLSGKYNQKCGQLEG